MFEPSRESCRHATDSNGDQMCGAKGLEGRLLMGVWAEWKRGSVGWNRTGGFADGIWNYVRQIGDAIFQTLA